MVEKLQGKMILAPLTRGGNLPFRRLCADLGMEAGVSEMVFARQLLKGDPIELARMRRAPNERLFGVQIASNDIEEACAAAQLIEKSGADWIDLNCGCPIHEATRRGLGSALLRKPQKLGSLVRGITQKSSLPLTVKVRLAAEGGEVNVREVVEALREAGAAAVTIHGRTATDRYSKSADWEAVRLVVVDGEQRGSAMAVIGNGDIYSHSEARERMRQSGVGAVMVGRGALVKPWLFSEFERSEQWLPDTRERVQLYRRLACYMKARALTPSPSSLHPFPLPLTFPLLQALPLPPLCPSLLISPPLPTSTLPAILSVIHSHPHTCLFSPPPPPPFPPLNSEMDLHRSTSAMTSVVVARRGPSSHGTSTSSAVTPPFHQTSRCKSACLRPAPPSPLSIGCSPTPGCSSRPAPC